MNRQAQNNEWMVAEPDGKVLTWERAGIAVLMDILRELRALHALLACSNAVAIPRILRRISANTAKPRRKKK